MTIEWKWYKLLLILRVNVHWFGLMSSSQLCSLVLACDHIVWCYIHLGKNYGTYSLYKGELCNNFTVMHISITVNGSGMLKELSTRYNNPYTAVGCWKRTEYPLQQSLHYSGDVERELSTATILTLQWDVERTEYLLQQSLHYSGMLKENWVPATTILTLQ